MTNQEKNYLQRNVRYHLDAGKSDAEIIKRLMKLDFKKETIRKYIKAFSKPTN